MNTTAIPPSSAGVDTLARLVAIEDIRQLKSRYFSAVDTKDWQAIARIFTEDAKVDFSGECQYHVGHHGVTDESINPADWVVIGGKATAEVIEGAVGGIIAVHQGHDPQIQIDTVETASGRWTLYDRLDYGPEVMHGYGHYDEKYRLVDGEWRIAALTLTRICVAWETR
ncbi:MULTISPECIES: nuclear transport factor 2 family protein [Rhizobium/Agrobacterium group]|uniref:nuclear transport factor 2 family protein n=1 Tax=Rhizobium/Agrobacterium group TaxID=227290 RepID=UPI001ADB86E9|nr:MULTISPECIES: nuclear transport factor 2 family protein [Rhizobium/Agrobacterium group]MBO9112672.1 nuclear transport factor 2 family protein [Agrobacterium sp. S2/73]QXZ76162.1 nuclear transport factor 2 family protein [Agrobacterium sp. S7/73]QYA17289.1 nuclear transport factor 2 family protein [Rhizobium sp. AB2/73]UEQ85594.1 nuclear transport factor 2 family protein [Rhizobium sp. AB2/73]